MRCVIICVCARLLLSMCLMCPPTLGHPSCLDMSKDLVGVIQTYRWQCMECKTCTVCQQPHHEDEMMFCDKCDRGYHTFCVGMDSIPTGLWVCEVCDKDFTTPMKKGGAKTPKKSKSAQKLWTASITTLTWPDSTQMHIIAFVQSLAEAIHLKYTKYQ